jgi:hypothetical protein
VSNIGLPAAGQIWRAVGIGDKQVGERSAVSFHRLRYHTFVMVITEKIQKQNPKDPFQIRRYSEERWGVPGRSFNSEAARGPCYVCICTLTPFSQLKSHKPLFVTRFHRFRHHLSFPSHFTTTPLSGSWKITKTWPQGRHWS